MKALERWWNIRKATIEDKDAILKIARQYRSELGYVHPVGRTGPITKDTVHVAERGGVLLGFVDFHQPKRGDNAGFSVVYHIATDKRQLCQGVGRALLYSVPCPIRLKCTVDNERGNAFYKNAGMFLERVEDGKKRALNVWRMNVLYVLVRGGNTTIPEVARKSGMAYGLRNDYKAYDYPFMLDILWEDYDWQKYLALIRQYRPAQAMVADYLRPEQRDLMLSQVQDLRDLGVTRIMCCPKFNGAAKDIPSDCIVAMSIPAPTYAGFIPDDLSELAERKLHLLGGSPEKQVRYMKQFHGVGALVISMDGNTHTHTIKADQVYEGGRFRKLKRGEKVSLLEQQIYSGINIRKHMNEAAVCSQLSLEAA